ncbi:MAG: GTP cyclohydrolase [Flavobacteriaceae bacterium]|nr:GTP cyclohydrolase [Flavobacteriaceae bacterium]|tara:strand:- start:667 stop:1797 length:1131 start_codon:yes stop_codon:yes gene_type:complete
MIEIVEVTSRQQFGAFFQFPFDLYRNCLQWVPPITKEEIDIFDPQKNAVFEHAMARLFLAKKKGKVVGRIAAMINWVEIEELKKTKVRFGWYDTIDDLEVSQKLIEAVEGVAIAEGMTYIEGPMGFSNMDKAGLLVHGYEHMNTMITWYHYPYQKVHLERLGLKKQSEWIEFKIDIYNAKDAPEKVKKFARVIKERFKLKTLEFKTTKDIEPHVDKMFELLNQTYNELQSFVPIQKHQIEVYKNKYLPYVHPDFIKCVVDENNEMIGFTITMPSFTKALKRINGKMFPFGFYHLWRAMRKNNRASFYLIGIQKNYQNKGVTAIIFQEIQEMFNKRGITKVETNPELEENKAIQALWKNYKHELHKRRRTYRKDISL